MTQHKANRQNTETRRYAQEKGRTAASILTHPEFLASSAIDSLENAHLNLSD